MERIKETWVDYCQNCKQVIPRKRNIDAIDHAYRENHVVISVFIQKFIIDPSRSGRTESNG